MQMEGTGVEQQSAKGRGEKKGVSKPQYIVVVLSGFLDTPSSKDMYEWHGGLKTWMYAQGVTHSPMQIYIFGTFAAIVWTGVEGQAKSHNM